MALTFQDLTIVVPVGPGETYWQKLVHDLSVLGSDSEVIVVFPDTDDIHGTASRWRETYPNVVFEIAPRGRATQLNHGAAKASRKVIWFLHADSRLNYSTLAGVEKVLLSSSDSLFYFDLKFSSDGPTWMVLNEWGAWLRSRILQLPFGDQGFLLKRSVFDAIGGFPLDCVYGEDHQFVWQATRQGVNVVPTGEALFTSARKYKDQGWARTTLHHQIMTYQQALPELWKTWTQKVSRKKHRST